MTGAVPLTWPTGAAALQVMGYCLMDIILHIGAHRTGTTTFQHFVQANTVLLARKSVGFWGPAQTRKSLFPGLFKEARGPVDRRAAKRAAGRVQLHLDLAQRAGLTHLLVSDENMIGTCQQNLRCGTLYAGIGERMARISAAFGGRVARVLLSVRGQDLWWASASAYAVARGHGALSHAKYDQIADARRGWRDVVTDLACAMPEAQIDVVPFEHVMGRPEALLEIATGIKVPADPQLPRLNAAPDLRQLRDVLAAQGSDPAALPDGTGRWQPLNTPQAAALRETYADDLHWLTAGADGLAHLTEDKARTRADHLPPGAMTEGQGHDTEKRCDGQRHIGQG